MSSPKACASSVGIVVRRVGGVAAGDAHSLGTQRTLWIAMLVCAVLNFVIEKVAYRPLRNAPRLAPLITAIGVSFLLQTLAMIIWGRNYHTFPQLISTTPLQPIPGVFVTPVQIAIVVVSALILKTTHDAWLR